MDIVQVACSCCVCLSGTSARFASQPAVLRYTSTLSARQVLKSVVARLPPCEAIQLQRASK